MNKVDFSKTNKKTAIVSYNVRLTLGSKHVRSTSIAYMREYILNIIGRDRCDILSIPLEEDRDKEYYKDIRDFESGKLDINEYDEIFIYNAQLNIYGGVFPVPSIPTIKAISKFNGEIWYMLTDPAMPPINVSLLIELKYKYCSEPNHIKMIDGTEAIFTPEDMERFTKNVYERTRIAFCGQDYKKYYDLYDPSKRVNRRKIKDTDWAYFGLHEYYAVRDFLDIKLQTPQKSENAYDFIYCGNKRGGTRDKIITNITNCDDIKTALMGYGNSIERENVTNYKYMQHLDMFNFINANAYSTIVMGDKLHNNNIITPRFYESMLLDVVAFIWHEYDKDKKIIKNKELRDFIYIKDTKDLHDKILAVRKDQELYNEIIDLERKEVFDMVGITDVEEFMASVNKNILNWKSSNKKNILV